MPESRTASGKAGAAKAAKDASTSEAQLAHVAMLYYREGLTQGDIAQRIGVSRATIVNYLRLARDLGIVDIRIRGESFTASSLSRQLTERFGLTDCYIAHHDGVHPGDEALLERVAQLAASAMRDLLAPGDRLGVAWGETLQQVARNFPNGPIPSLTICQLIGSMAYDRLHAPEACAIEIARKTLSPCHTLHAPAVVSSADLAGRMRQEPILAQQLADLQALSKAIFSVGSLRPPKTVIGSRLVSEEELAFYLGAGAVAVFWGHFIGPQGERIAGPLDGRLIGADLETLRAIPMRMLVAAGPSKHDPILAALHGGYATHLVTDEDAARMLLSA